MSLYRYTQHNYDALPEWSTNRMHFIFLFFFKSTLTPMCTDIVYIHSTYLQGPEKAGGPVCIALGSKEHIAQKILRVLHRNLTVQNYLKRIRCSVIKCCAQCDDSFGVKTVCISLFVHALIFLQCLPESRGQAGDGQDEMVFQAAGSLL